MRQVFDALGGDYAYNAVAAQLSTMAKAGKLRRDANVSRGGRYWITDLAGKDMRSDPSRAGRRTRAAKAGAAKRVLGPKPETRDSMCARMHAEVLAKSRPKPAPKARFIQPPQKSLKQRTVNAPTVDEFVRRGGRIEYLERHASSNPLLFDHSQTHVPIGKRQPSTRQRPAPGR